MLVIERRHLFYGGCVSGVVICFLSFYLGSAIFLISVLVLATDGDITRWNTLVRQISRWFKEASWWLKCGVLLSLTTVKDFWNAQRSSGLISKLHKSLASVISFQKVRDKFLRNSQSTGESSTYNLSFNEDCLQSQWNDEGNCTDDSEEDFPVYSPNIVSSYLSDNSRTSSINMSHNWSGSSLNHGTPKQFLSDRVVHPSPASPWGFCVSPQTQLKYRSRSGNDVQTATGTLLTTTRLKIMNDVGMGGVQEQGNAGFVNRVMNSRSPYVQSPYKSPGQYPLIHLNKTPLPPLTHHNTQKTPKRRSVRVCVAPPSTPDGNSLGRNSPRFSRPTEPLNPDGLAENPQSVISALQEISRKRIHSVEAEENSLKRQRTELAAAVTPTRVESAPDLLTNVQSQEKMNLGEEISTPKPVSTAKRNKNNEILSSLSSSRTLKRQVADNWSRGSTPVPVGKHLRTGGTPQDVAKENGLGNEPEENENETMQRDIDDGDEPMPESVSKKGKVATFAKDLESSIDVRDCTVEDWMYDRMQDERRLQRILKNIQKDDLQKSGEQGKDSAEKDANKKGKAEEVVGESDEIGRVPEKQRTLNVETPEEKGKRKGEKEAKKEKFNSLTNAYSPSNFYSGSTSPMFSLNSGTRVVTSNTSPIFSASTSVPTISTVNETPVNRSSMNRSTAQTVSSFTMLPTPISSAKFSGYSASVPNAMPASKADEAAPSPRSRDPDQGGFSFGLPWSSTADSVVVSPAFQRSASLSPPSTSVSSAPPCPSFSYGDVPKSSQNSSSVPSPSAASFGSANKPSAMATNVSVSSLPRGLTFGTSPQCNTTPSATSGIDFGTSSRPAMFTASGSLASVPAMTTSGFSFGLAKGMSVEATDQNKTPVAFSATYNISPSVLSGDDCSGVQSVTTAFGSNPSPSVAAVTQVRTVAPFEQVKTSEPASTPSFGAQSENAKSSPFGAAAPSVQSIFTAALTSTPSVASIFGGSSKTTASSTSVTETGQPRISFEQSRAEAPAGVQTTTTQQHVSFGSSGGFNFGSQPMVAPSTTSQSPFSFVPTTTVASGAGFGSQDSSAPKMSESPVQSTYSFGSPASGAGTMGSVTATTTSALQAQPAFSTVSQQAASQAQSPFSFGTAATTAPTTVATGFGQGSFSGFGSATTTAATTNAFGPAGNVFGSSGSSKPPGFGFGTGGFGATANANQPPPYSMSTTPQQQNVFGSATSVNQPSGFPTTTASSGFGSATTASKVPSFGSVTSASPSFGAIANSNQPVQYGSASNASQPPAYGSVTSMNQTPTFGTGANPNQTATFGAGTNANQTPTFGAGANANQTPTFGAGTNANQTPTFGAGANQTSTFGANANQTPTFGTGTNSNHTPAFGVGTNTSQTHPFGADINANQAPVFGAGTSATQTPTFGAGANTNQTPAFGASTNANQTPSFGFGSNTTQQPAANSAFGSTTSTNPPPSFGFGVPTTASGGFPFKFSSAPTTTAAAGFGFQSQAANTTTASTGFGSTGGNLFQFGSSAAPSTTTSAPVFGFGASQSTASSGFKFDLGGPKPVSGGLFPATAPGPAPSFGSSTANDPQSQGGFGAGFGSAAQAVPVQFQFGSNAPAAGNAPFAFGAPSNAQPSSAGFNFGAPQQQQGPGFGVQQSPYGAPQAQPGFGFNAAPAAAAARQPMFSIGTGSSAPRSRTMRARRNIRS